MEKYSLLQSQAGIIAYCLEYPDSTYYNLPFYIELSSQIDVERLCKAWEVLYSSRPVLKTKLEIDENGEILQYCDETMDIPVIVRECSHNELLEYIDNGFIRPFSLFSGEPLSRVEIVTTEKGIYMLWDIHHAIADYTVINKIILQEDLSKAYESLELPPEKFTLKEAVDLEHESFKSEEYQTSKEYFLNNFGDINFHTLGNQIFKTPGEMVWAQSYINTEEVDNWCQKNNVKPPMLFQAAFTHVCSVLFRKDDFGYFTTYHGRNDERLMNCYGMLVKTIPLKNANPQNSSVLEYMRSSYDELKKSLTHSIYPSIHFSKELQVLPKLIFNFVAKKNVNYDVIIGKNKFQLIHIKRIESNDAVNVQIGLRDDNYEIRLETGANIMEEKSLKLLAEAIKTVIKNMMMSPSSDIREIPLIPLDDKELPLKLLELGGGKKVNIEKEDNILSAFKQKAIEQPDAPAVNYDDNQYSYAQIDRMSDVVSSVLMENANIQKGDIVGVYISRGEKMITYPLGIMKCGAAYMPLDKKLPQERLETMCEDAGIKAVITEDNIPQTKFESFTDIILSESDFDFEDDNLEHPDVQITHDDSAVVLYTSGSTGKPKGVTLSHGGIINFSRWLQNEIELKVSDKVSAYASFGFDAHLIDIYSSLITGSQLFIIPDEIRVDISLLTKFLNEKNITVGFFTTRIAHILNSEEHNLRVILTGGEKIQPLFIKDHQLINGYGPTECTIYSTFYKAEGRYDGNVIGRPLPNYQLLIIDQNKNLVPQGLPGELLIAGRGLSFGYMNRPELNAEKFIDYNITEDVSIKAYRTGDLVHYDKDGNIVYICRDDNLVKLRGYRIELAEIEEVASNFSGITEVAAKVQKDNLCLYYASKIHISNDELKGYLSKYLPEYMVPSLYLLMKEFPYNINSKIDRDKLPPISPDREVKYEEPQGLLENAIAFGFKTVFGLNKVIGRNDEFTALGGDSISVMSLIVKLREHNIEVSVKDVLEAQSVKEIAKRTKYKRSTQQISQDEYKGFVDTTPIIQHFWDSNLKKPSYFNQSFLFKAKDKIDIDILKKAMTAVINHHDILRAKVKDGKLYVGGIGEEDYFTIETCESEDYAKETERINNEIDIFNGPLIRLVIFEKNCTDELYIVIHHLIVDGFSWRVITEDLNLAYAQILNGDDIALPEKTSSYQDYALAIKKYRNSEDIQKQKAYWEDTITSLKNGKHTIISSNVRKMKKISLKYPKEKSLILLTKCSNNFNVSVNALFLSAISKSWKDVMGEDELSLRIESHGREEFDKDLLIDRTVGWFTACYPFILKFKGKTPAEVMNNVEKSLNNVPKKGFGYPILMGIETKELPLLTFNYLGEMNAIRTGEMFVTYHRPDLAYYTTPENNYGSDININGYSVNRETHFELEYNSERFGKEDMEKFGEVFLKALDDIVEYSSDENYENDIHIFSEHPDRKHLFFIHSASYGSEFFHYIAQELKDDFSFSVIEPYNIRHKETPLTSIEEMAEKYIEIIKSVQSKGPFNIGGLCFGGAVALEIAKKLEKDDEKVEKLILFDTHYIDDVNLQISIMKDQLLYAREYLKEGILNPKEEIMEDMIFNARLASKIWLDYVPKHYDGETVYFRATNKPEGDLTNAANQMYDYVMGKKAGGYEDFLDEENLQIVDVPVEHNDMFCKEGLDVIVPYIKKFIG